MNWQLEYRKSKTMKAKMPEACEICREAPPVHVHNLPETGTEVWCCLHCHNDLHKVPTFESKVPAELDYKDRPLLGLIDSVIEDLPKPLS